MKRMLLIGEYYSSNLGDNLLCQCMEKYLKAIYNNVAIEWADLTYGGKPLKWKKYCFAIIYKLDKLGISKFRENFFSIVRAFFVACEVKRQLKSQNFDAIIFAGGQIFLDYFVEQIREVIKQAEYYQTPVYFNACGGGKLSPSSIIILKKALSFNCVKRITTRDSTSFIQRLTTAKVSQLSDIAILSAKLFGITKSFDSKVIGLGVISPSIYNKNNVKHYSENHFFEFWRRTIEKLQSYNLEWQLFTNGSEDDYLFAERLLSYLSLKDDRLLAPRPMTAESLISQISSYKSIISFRLHSQIIAYSLDIPAIGIIWDRKVLEFSLKIGMGGENVFYLNNVDVDFLISIIHRIPFYNVNRRNVLANEIKESLSTLLN